MDVALVRCLLKINKSLPYFNYVFIFHFSTLLTSLSAKKAFVYYIIALCKSEILHFLKNLATSLRCSMKKKTKEPIGELKNLKKSFQYPNHKYPKTDF